MTPKPNIYDTCGPCRSGNHAKCYDPCDCKDRGHRVSETQPSAHLSDDARLLAFYREQVTALVRATDAKDIGAMSRAYEALYHVSTGLPLPPAPLSVWWYARSDTHVSDEPGGHWDIAGLTDGGEDWRRYRGRLVTRTQMDEALQEFRASNRGVGARLVRVEVYEDGSERETEVA